MDFNKRQKQLVTKLIQANFDAMLVTNPVNIKYLCGFDGDAGVLLVLPDATYLITDDRFEVALAEQNLPVKVKITRDYLATVCQLLAKTNAVLLGFEASLAYEQFDFLDENCPASIEVTPDFLAELRSIKDDEEIKRLKAAGTLAKQAYQFVLAELASTPKMPTEWQLAAKLDYWLKNHGASVQSFETIVASGDRSAMPHATASFAPIANNSGCTLDFGSFVNDYTFDVTRTFAVGKVNPKLKEIYQVVAAAKNAAIEAIKPGKNWADIDVVGRNIIAQAGFGEFFKHGMGHGIGLSIHEAPYVGTTAQGIVKAGQVVTIEPGIYLPGIGGVRLEDDILVTQTGSENLTNFGNEWRQI